MLLRSIVAASVLAATMPGVVTPFSSVAAVADTASEIIMRIEVYDYTAPAFSGVIAFGHYSYRFSDREANERTSYGNMRIREVLVPVDRAAVLAASGSAWPISICLQVPAAKYSQCVPTNQEQVLDSGTVFGFGPEGWTR